MHDADSRIRALILAYEDLDAEDRQKADEFLARNPEFRLQLARLQQLEALAREPIPTDLGDASREPTLSAQDEEQLARSLEALLERLGLSETASAAKPVAPASSSRVPRRATRRSWLPLAAAAALLLLVWAPWSGRSPVQFRDATVIAVDATTRSTRAPENAATWKSGEAFALSFRLEASAHLAVYHVDPTGQVSLVVPESTVDPMPYFEAGPTHQIPSAMGEQQWVLGGEAGWESFLLAARGDSELDLELLGQQISDNLSGLSDRELVMGQLRELLDEHFDTVQLIEFEHLP